MIGNSFDTVPNLKMLTDKVALLAGVTYWNAGVNVVLYRNGNDHISFHSDDTHNEALVSTVLISTCANMNRPTIFKSKNTNRPSTEPQIKVMLFLQPGDAYFINRDVQDHFDHGVEKLKPIFATAKTKNNDDNSTVTCESLDNDTTTGERLVVVCRYGDEKQFTKDSGQSQLSLLPKLKQPLAFGAAANLVVDKAYSKNELRNMNVHT